MYLQIPLFWFNRYCFHVMLMFLIFFNHLLLSFACRENSLQVSVHPQKNKANFSSFAETVRIARPVRNAWSRR